MTKNQADVYVGPFDGQQPNSQKIEKQRRDTEDAVDVHSVFHTLQGEGPFTGVPAVFVRLAGCNLQCPQCDTEYTLGRRMMHPVEVVSAVSAKPLHDGGLVVITGGEPFRQPYQLSKLVDALLDAGYYIQIETNGTLPVPEGIRPYCKVHVSTVGPRRGVYVVLSPKTGKAHEDTVSRACCFKYVLAAGSAHPDDGLPLSALQHSCKPHLARPPSWWDRPVYVQPADEQDKQRNALNRDAVVGACMRFGYTAQLQMHKYLGLE